jgi:transcriptional regulator with XRE-family HTH domain
MRSDDFFAITGAQLRAGRALLRWSADDLAKKARIGVATVRRAEAQDDEITATVANTSAMRQALEDAGLEFIFENGGGAGIRFRERRG